MIQNMNYGLNLKYFLILTIFSSLLFSSSIENDSNEKRKIDIQEIHETKEFDEYKPVLKNSIQNKDNSKIEISGSITIRHDF